MEVQTQSPFVQHAKFGLVEEKKEKNMSESDTPTSPPPEPYEIRILTENDTKNVLEFLYTFFFKDEPINVAVELQETIPCPEMEVEPAKCIKSGYSVIAITLSGKIVGVCLNDIIKREDPEGEEPIFSNARLAKVMKLLFALDKEANVFEKYPDVNKTMFLKIMSVDDAWRGKGIAKKLIEKARSIGLENGCTLIRIDCTSYFSAKAAIRLGFEPIHSIKYKEFKEDGKPLFLPEDPHNEATVCVQRISC